MSENTTNVSYQVEDGTGEMDVRTWANDKQNESDYEAQKSSQLVAGVYVRIIGQIKSFTSRNFIQSWNVTKITDFNEIACHFFEVLYCKSYFAKKVVCCVFC